MVRFSASFRRLLVAFALLQLAMVQPAAAERRARTNRPGARTPSLRAKPGTLVRQYAHQFNRARHTPTALTGKAALQNADATFSGTHPMFQRLHRAGWYQRTGAINKLQVKADKLRKNRKISLKTPLSEVEFLSFDLEATNGNAGSYKKGLKAFLSGYDEVIQFGYTVHKGGKIVKRGTIDIKPDVAIAEPVARLTKLNENKLAKAKRFEDVAGKIIDVMHGRVLVGQSAIKKDWGWLQSNFARLGVDLPQPKRMILDTRLLSFNYLPAGGGLKGLAEHFRVSQAQAHNAGDDAAVTGNVLNAMMTRSGARTLGDAFRLQHVGYQLMKQPQPQAQPTKAQ